jgi:hypothetical protein
MEMVAKPLFAEYLGFEAPLPIFPEEQDPVYFTMPPLLFAFR